MQEATIAKEKFPEGFEWAFALPSFISFPLFVLLPATEMVSGGV